MLSILYDIIILEASIMFCYDLLDTVHTGDKSLQGLLRDANFVKQPWLQVMYCAVYLPCGSNFRRKEEV